MRDGGVQAEVSISDILATIVTLPVAGEVHGAESPFSLPG